MNDYPSKLELSKLLKYEFHDGVQGFLTLFEETWNHHYGRMWKTKGKMHLATGGWSGNEEIIYVLEKTLFWAIAWEESKRGGYYKFDMSRCRKIMKSQRGSDGDSRT